MSKRWDLQEHAAFLVPKEGLMIPDPKTMKPLADTGEFKLLSGEGRECDRGQTSRCSESSDKKVRPTIT